MIQVVRQQVGQLAEQLRVVGQLRVVLDQAGQLERGAVGGAAPLERATPARACNEFPPAPAREVKRQDASADKAAPAPSTGVPFASMRTIERVRRALGTHPRRWDSFTGRTRRRIDAAGMALLPSSERRETPQRWRSPALEEARRPRPGAPPALRRNSRPRPSGPPPARAARGSRGACHPARRPHLVLPVSPRPPDRHAPTRPAPRPGRHAHRPRRAPERRRAEPPRSRSRPGDR